MVGPCVDHNILVSSEFTLGQVRPTDFRSIKRPCLWEVKCGEKKNCIELDPLPQLTKLSANRSWKNHQTIQRLDADRKRALTLMFFCITRPSSKFWPLHKVKCHWAKSFSWLWHLLYSLILNNTTKAPKMLHFARRRILQEGIGLIVEVCHMLVGVMKATDLMFFPSSNLLRLVVIVV